MTLSLYNTLTRDKEIFEPLAPPAVSLYSCGPTVYSQAHIGNLRTYIFVDTLRRILELDHYQVNHVMNITDVGHLTDDADAGQDKVEQQAVRENKPALEIAKNYERMFQDDIKALNVLPPTAWARATEYIDQQIALIQKLEKGGFTYLTSDGVYFDTSKIKDYGKMAKLDIEGLRPGARIESIAGKRQATDFALWKLTPQSVTRLMEWDSPWGRGWPGWHIECSAMALELLGETIDLHTGGIDHIPVHHTNEIAQSEAATGQPFVRYWLHGEFLVIDEGRMGKSEGNALTLETLRRKGFDPLAYRFWLLQTHYRTKLNFTWDALESAARGYDRLKRAVNLLGDRPESDASIDFEKKFLQAMNDDLDTPRALATLFDYIRSEGKDRANRQSIGLVDRALGLNLLTRPVFQIPTNIQTLADERETARKQNDWARADQLRSAIEQAGFVIDDTETGSIVSPRPRQAQ
jgi:cysteinyl-tRNA synthetase